MHNLGASRKKATESGQRESLIRFIAEKDTRGEYDPDILAEMSVSSLLFLSSKFEPDIESADFNQVQVERDTREARYAGLRTRYRE